MTFRLIHESTESLLGFQTVLKFSQQEFAISCQELIRDRNLASKMHLRAELTGQLV